MWKQIATMIVSLALCAATASHAQQRATSQEAVALVKRAVAHVHKNGLEKALKDFNRSDGGFTDRDLYIVVLDLNGKCLAHGVSPRIIGKDLSGFKDVDGKPFIQEELRIAKTNGSGWVDFKFVNPANQNIENKSQYLERVGDVIVMSGFYKD
jgi:signal transduction histidine kinase